MKNLSYVLCCVLFCSVVCKKVYVLNDDLLGGNGYFYTLDSTSGKVFQSIDLDNQPAGIYSHGCAGWDYRTPFGETLFVQGNTAHLWKWGSILSNNLERWTFSVDSNGKLHPEHCYPFKAESGQTYVFANTTLNGGAMASIGSWSDGNSCPSCGIAITEVQIAQRQTKQEIIHNFPPGYWENVGCSVTGAAITSARDTIFVLCDFIGANFTMFTFDLTNKKLHRAMNVSGNAWPDLPPTVWNFAPDGTLWALGLETNTTVHLNSINPRTGETKHIREIDTTKMCPNNFYFINGWFFDFPDDTLYVGVTGANGENGCIAKVSLKTFKVEWHTTVSPGGGLHVANVLA